MSELKNPAGPATYKQTWALFCLTKKDYRKEGLTCQEAHDLLQKLMAEQGERKSSKDWLKIYNSAVKAGLEGMTKAKPTPMIVSGYGREYYVEGGVCGFAWVTIPFKTSENKAFINAMKKSKICSSGEDKYRYPISKAYGGGFQYWVSEGGQSMQTKEAFAQGFAKVLAENGIQCYVGSRMD